MRRSGPRHDDTGESAGSGSPSPGGEGRGEGERFLKLIFGAGGGFAAQASVALSKSRNFNADSPICAGIAPDGTVSIKVFFHKSHITQRHGHSRLVRKIVATETISPDSARSSSTRKAWGLNGSSLFRAPRRARIQRSRSVACSG